MVVELSSSPRSVTTTGKSPRTTVAVISVVPPSTGRYHQRSSQPSPATTASPTRAATNFRQRGRFFFAGTALGLGGRVGVVWDASGCGEGFGSVAGFIDRDS